MKTFNILNNVVSFDEGLIGYIEIMQEELSYQFGFDDRHMAKPSKKIVTIEDFVLQVQELYDSYEEEYMKLAEELVNLYIRYGVYDMSKDLIISNNVQPLSKHLERMKPIVDEIAVFTSEVNQGVIEIESKWKNIVDEAVPGHYFQVYSPHYSDILLNDYFNHKEEKRVEKKRERLYNENASKTLNEYMSQIVELCKSYIKRVQQVIYEDIVEMIKEMYNNFAIDLAERGIISSFGQYTNNNRTDAILENINKIAIREDVEEQLVKLLQNDSLNINVHYEIIKHISNNDIPEYIELIKFLKLQNSIFVIYYNERLNGNQGNTELNNKCLKILKSLTDVIDIDFLFYSLLNFSECYYIDSVFLTNIKTTRICFECFKDVFGSDNKIINEKEQSMFVTAIKEVSKGTDLVYDGSISRFDYNYLCEFWEKAKNQRNATIKRKEITDNVSNTFANWAANNIKTIIILIIIFILYLLSK